MNKKQISLFGRDNIEFAKSDGLTDSEGFIETKTSLGICLGASSIKIVSLLWREDNNGYEAKDGQDDFTILKSSVVSNKGNPKDTLLKLLSSPDFPRHDFICITGRKAKETINQPTITEPEASEYALNYYRMKSGNTIRALISLGSENFVFYELDKTGQIINVRTGSKCASGTGEFFLQQIRRMNISLEEAIELAHKSDAFQVSGRCSVFCKSDCTHALNKGMPTGKVAAGLGVMVAEKIVELAQSHLDGPILFVGGVTRNSYIMDHLRKKIGHFIIPEEGEYFEALGAAICARKQKMQQVNTICFDSRISSFSVLPPLVEAQHRVIFREFDPCKPESDDACIIGLDVGSTTTKSVLLRLEDNAVISSVYLRTNGKPVKAARDCYAAMVNDLGDISVKVVGLGVTGSGRQITGLHGQTDEIITEILAHAAAAAYFNPDVDTIFEIGGQDAKYTHLVNGVPCDYAMNEACSAGTGSFLEEAIKESFNIDYRKIEDIALQGKLPPNFNDQCAAFINSDIKDALQENVDIEDIIAGLVYSICMNYNNRVKGQRRIGEQIFMQGGVCYNRAVPLAMATLLDRDIIVPPEPGLMGAFGVALEVKNRINVGLLKEKHYELEELAKRDVKYGKSFICSGKGQDCDRNCSINIIKVDSKNYTFGGACNLHYNLVHKLSIEPKPFDLVTQRQHLVFDRYEEFYDKNDLDNRNRFATPVIGIPKSLYVNTLFPLYYHFFKELGCEVVLSDGIEQEGCKKVTSSFCYPVEVAHGVFQNLLNKNPDYIFLPHVAQVYVPPGGRFNTGDPNVCIMAEGEHYCFRSVFRQAHKKLISPILDFSKGWHTMDKQFAEVASSLNYSKEQAHSAYTLAVSELRSFLEARKKIGDQLLKELEEDRSKIAIVLFGRPYNAFVGETNLGIPRKFASRGIYVLPFDSLRYDDEDCIENIAWASSQELIKAAYYVKKHPQLFGVFVTNFGCGPDSIILTYFRDIMKNKPSLTLELDSHSADAGINTRVEAFLDIVERYVKLGIKDKSATKSFRMATVVKEGKKFRYISSKGDSCSVKDPRVKLLLPSMGRTSSELVSAAMRNFGFNCKPVSPPDFNTLMLGRKHTLCKECLPLILVIGSMLEYEQARTNNDELILYFMPTSIGSCRFCQYYVFLRRLIEKKKIPNLAMLTFSAGNSFAGIGTLNTITLLKSIIVADIMDDIRNAICVLAVDTENALCLYDEQMQRISTCIEARPSNLYVELKKVADALATISLKYPLSKAKKVLLSGEIYVRKEEFSSEGVVKRLIKDGIVVKRAPVLEYLHYTDSLTANEAAYSSRMGFRDKLEIMTRNLVKRRIEVKIKNILAHSHLYEYETVDLKKTMEMGSRFINKSFTGEMILVIGSFFKEITHHVHGMISIGPFACLPTRLIEAILSQECRVAGNDRLQGMHGVDHLKKFTTLPFLSVECDGNPLPQVLQSRLDAFCLQVDRLHKRVT